MNKIEICKQIQDNIHRLSETEIIEIFKIIVENKTEYTKNNNGIFLNLNWVDIETLNKIENYINFCIKSQNEISKYEIMKTLLNDTIKQTDKISNNVSKTVDLDERNNACSNKQKIPSSMKFYLLKKKYMKQNIIINNLIDNELTYEDYIIM
jgi:hypothetical protein